MYAELTKQIESLARAAGFDLFGVAPADPFDQERERFQSWLASGYAGQMEYLRNNSEKRLDPRKILPSAKTIICLGISYYYDSLSLREGDSRRSTLPLKMIHSTQCESAESGLNPDEMDSPSARNDLEIGKIARYAWGRDYHKVLAKKLKQLKKQIVELAGPQTQLKEYTDTGPLLERQAAARAELGFIGKNTLLLHPKHGSFFFLSELLTNLDLQCGTPITTSCGSCRACLDACPTQAFPKPYELDATKCIAYWTIEARGDIPGQFHEAIGNWVFGCDICQEVCPFNRRPLPSRCQEFAPEKGVGPALDPEKTLRMDEAAFQAAFAATPLTRAKHSGIIRNAKIVIKNHPHHPHPDPPLSRGREADLFPSPFGRG